MKDFTLINQGEEIKVDKAKDDPHKKLNFKNVGLCLISKLLFNSNFLRVTLRDIKNV